MTVTSSLIAGMMAAVTVYCLVNRDCGRLLRDYSLDDSREFEIWKARENKTYQSPAEQIYRMRIFSAKRKEVNRHNEDPSQIYKKGINRFSDLTHQEYVAKYVSRKKDSLAKFTTNPLPKHRILSTFTAPDTIDWSKTPVINRVYDKKECKACYAFASIQAVEASLYIENRITEVLSIENIVDCTSEVPYTNSGCDGGCVFMSLRYIKEQGVATNESYPYTAGDSGSSSYCQSKINRPFRIMNYYPIPKGRSDLLKNLVSHKPVAVSIDSSVVGDYSSGIYDGSKCGSNEVTGFMLLVGYGVEKTNSGNIKYWLLKNHMGTNWGMNGFMKLIREEGQVAGKCGITDSGVYVET